MQATNIDAIERTIQKTNEWLRDIEAEMGARDRAHAYHALRSTLHALRDRLTPEEVLHLGAQLPSLIRGVYYEGWRLHVKPVRLRSVAEFLDVIALDAGNPEIGTERTARAVLAVLAQRVSRGEIKDIRRCLPQPIRDLFPRPSLT